MAEKPSFITNDQWAGNEIQFPSLTPDQISAVLGLSGESQPNMIIARIKADPKASAAIKDYTDAMTAQDKLFAGVIEKYKDQLGLSVDDLKKMTAKERYDLVTMGKYKDREDLHLPLTEGEGVSIVMQVNKDCKRKKNELIDAIIGFLPQSPGEVGEQTFGGVVDWHDRTPKDWKISAFRDLHNLVFNGVTAPSASASPEMTGPGHEIPPAAKQGAIIVK